MARSAHAHAHREAAVLPSPRVPVAAPARRPSARGSERSRATTASAPRAHSRRVSRLPARLVVFVACLSVLAVGRVTLSFAVVQKNIQTDAVVREYRGLDAENAQLAEQAAGLSSSLAVHDIAVRRYHLAVPARVEYVTVPARALNKLGAQR
jgi:cell division protein FtsB